jgi:hypothetical protein
MYFGRLIHLHMELSTISVPPSICAAVVPENGTEGRTRSQELGDSDNVSDSPCTTGGKNDKANEECFRAGALDREKTIQVLWNNLV